MSAAALARPRAIAPGSRSAARRPRAAPRRALPPDGPADFGGPVVRLYADDEVLPEFVDALARLACAPTAPIALSGVPGAAPAACLSDVAVPPPLEQTQILSALAGLAEAFPDADAIAPAAFRLLLARDADGYVALAHAYERYLAALSDLRELVAAAIGGG